MTREVVEGSGYGEWTRRLPCYVCGERIVKARQRVGFHFDDLTGNHQAWHFECADGPESRLKLAATGSPVKGES